MSSTPVWFSIDVLDPVDAMQIKLHPSGPSRAAPQILAYAYACK